MRTAVLVSGSREWKDWRVIKDRLQRYPDGTILIHGGAVGADYIAHRYGLHRGWDIHRYPYFRDLEKRGGHVRNACMFEALLLLQRFAFACFFEAFPLDGPGTAGMIRLVEKHNVTAVAPIPSFVWAA